MACAALFIVFSSVSFLVSWNLFKGNEFCHKLKIINPTTRLNTPFNFYCLFKRVSFLAAFYILSHLPAPFASSVIEGSLPDGSPFTGLKPGLPPFKLSSINSEFYLTFYFNASVYYYIPLLCLVIYSFCVLMGVEISLWVFKIILKVWSWYSTTYDFQVKHPVVFSMIIKMYIILHSNTD